MPDHSLDLTLYGRRGWWQGHPVLWVTGGATGVGRVDSIFVLGADDWEELAIWRWRRRRHG